MAVGSGAGVPFPEGRAWGGEVWLLQHLQTPCLVSQWAGLKCAGEAW